ncbi:3-hydroxyacyl-CoA dehydrogenase family protein [Chloroflexota bacterium]
MNPACDGLSIRTTIERSNYIMGLENIKQVTVIGAGTMGSGIAELLSRVGGYQVVLCDTTDEVVQRGLQNQRNNLQKFSVDKGKITAEEMEAILGRIKTMTSPAEAAAQADFVIEAVFENMELKKTIFQKLDEATPPHAILASNTSTLSITEIASATNKPEKVIGTHFFNPVPLMGAVEIIRGVLTSDETVELVKNLVLKLDKTPVVVKDSPGFASTRLGVALFLEASKMLEEGIASVKDIDRGARLFYAHRMGPFETCDIVGLDARLNNLNALYQATGDPKWAPPLLLKQLVSAGYIGKKPGSKGGYYAYFGLEKD